MQPEYGLISLRRIGHSEKTDLAVWNSPDYVAMSESKAGKTVVSVQEKATGKTETRTFLQIEQSSPAQLSTSRPERSISMDTPIILITHGNCQDGVASAWMAKRFFKDRGVEVIYAQYEKRSFAWANWDFTGRDVFFIDYSTTRDEICRIAKDAKTVVILDHHETAQAALRDPASWAPSNVEILFDMARSGAMMAYDYFASRDPDFGQCPLIPYIQDRDLFTFRLNETRPVAAYMSSQPFDPLQYARINDQLVQGNLADIVRLGTAILDYQYRMVVSMTNSSRLNILVDAKGRKFALFNATMLVSDAGHQCLEDYPELSYSMSWFDKVLSSTEVERVYSLRSRKGGVNVAEIARDMGGGGHQSAAGFSQILPLDIGSPMMTQEEAPCTLK